MQNTSPFVRAVALSASITALIVMAGPAFALSEIAPDENAPAETSGEVERQPLPPPPQQATPPAVPMPDPVRPPTGSATEPAQDEPEPAAAEPGDETPETDDPARPVVDPASAPEILYDVSKLPEPVQRMRSLILEATKSGEIEKLRSLLGTGDSATRLDFGDVEGDPVGYLIGNSGDGEGQEILAILEEVLEAGFVHLDAGKPEERYLWPYFAAMPFDKLTPAQRVEMFHIITAGDFDDMRAYGIYTFYRTAITPDGKWTFFLAGE